ncbi:MAG: hypothetical protein ACFFAU_04770 [Candidatus Hodarchaeota archaeon]
MKNKQLLERGDTYVIIEQFVFQDQIYYNAQGYSFLLILMKNVLNLDINSLYYFTSYLLTPLIFTFSVIIFFSQISSEEISSNFQVIVIFVSNIDLYLAFHIVNTKQNLSLSIILISLGTILWISSRIKDDSLKEIPIICIILAVVALLLIYFHFFSGLIFILLFIPGILYIISIEYKKVHSHIIIPFLPSSLFFICSYILKIRSFEFFRTILYYLNQDYEIIPRIVIINDLIHYTFLSVVLYFAIIFSIVLLSLILKIRSYIISNFINEKNRETSALILTFFIAITIFFLYALIYQDYITSNYDSILLFLFIQMGRILILNFSLYSFFIPDILKSNEKLFILSLIIIGLSIPLFILSFFLSRINEVMVGSIFNLERRIIDFSYFFMISIMIYFLLNSRFQKNQRDSIFIALIFLNLANFYLNPSLT